MTAQEHKVQRDMVVRSLLVSQSRTERGEERPRKPTHPKRAAWVMPAVNERRL